MEKKIKVTFFQSGMPVQARIFIIYGWSDLPNQMTIQGIMEETVMKIEIVLEASNANTFDTTKELD